ncbi:hypothetical protein ACFSWE_02180 [Leucobacter albus]|uniref:Ribosomally synthesized peptide with SipW-like signal peptide n=1 Tax=Leucobacter albus TaxID=272210 RepID=A0ABW3TN87_9MICO
MNEQPTMAAQQQRVPRRAWATLGLLVGTAALLTAATVVERHSFDAVFTPGAEHDFNIQVDGSYDDSWTLERAQWHEGRPNTLTIEATPDGSGVPLPPGRVETFLLGVRNASPTLASTLTVELFDPDPLGAESDPTTGSRLELFDALHFTLSDGEHVIVSGSGAEALSGAWQAGLAPTEARLLTLTILLPESVTNDYNGAGTGVGIRFDGSSL